MSDSTPYRARLLEHDAQQAKFRAQLSIEAAQQAQQEFDRVHGEVKKAKSSCSNVAHANRDESFSVTNRPKRVERQDSSNYVVLATFNRLVVAEKEAQDKLERARAEKNQARLEYKMIRKASMDCTASLLKRSRRERINRWMQSILGR